MRLANGLVKSLKANASVTAMHLSLSSELHHYNIEEYEKESFVEIIDESKVLSQQITTLFKPTNDIDSDIVEVANKGDYDLLLVGVGQSMFEGSLLGKILGFTTKIINPDRLIDQVTGRKSLFENSPFDERTRHIVSRSTVPVGVLLDKDLERLDYVFIPIFTESDEFLFRYAQKLISSSKSQVVILDAASQIKKYPQIKESIRAIEQNAPNHISLLNERKIDKQFLKNQDIMLISFESWKKLVDTKSLWLSDVPSTLILTQ